METLDFESILPRMLPFDMPGPVRGLLGRALGLDEIGRLYGTLAGDGAIAARLLEALEIDVRTSQTDLRRIPRTGACVMVVNHPHGILDGAAVAALLRGVRPDVRILANDILMAVPELRELLIPVNGKSGGLRRALEHLLRGGMLIIFPAGEVSRFRWKSRAVQDRAWHPSVVRLIEIASRRGVRVPVVPCHITGTNSMTFHLAGPFATAMLGRELLKKRGSTVEVRIGSPVGADKLLGIPTERERIEYLRWRSDLLGGRNAFKPQTSKPLGRELAREPEAIADAVSPHVLAAEIARLTPLIASGDLAVYLAAASEIPNALCELGRLREITFRAAGEGTGKALDLDRFDRHYLHLFVWHATRCELVGAYRIGQSDRARELYTATLFEYGDAFLDRLGPALELGRSFVRQEYQRAFAPLLLLWKGIGRYVAQNPEYKVLFGPVSISNQYQALSRDLMVSFLEKYAWLRGWSGVVRQRNPWRGRRHAVLAADLDELSAVVADLEPDHSGVPVLLRQYLKLGGRLLGFNVDPEFANALDGLILVDLTRTEPKLLERYLGKHEANTFLEFQRGTHATH